MCEGECKEVERKPL